MKKIKKYYLLDLLTRKNFTEFLSYIKRNSDYCNLIITSDEYAKIIKVLQGVRNLNTHNDQTKLKRDFILMDIKNLERYGTHYVPLSERDKNFKPVPQESITQDERSYIDMQIKICKDVRENAHKQLAVMEFYELKKLLHDKTKNSVLEK